MRLAGVSFEPWHGDLLLGSVKGESALDAWRRLRAGAAGIGRWPILVGDEEELERAAEVWEQVAEDREPKDVLGIASRIDADRWLEGRWAEVAEGDPAWSVAFPPLDIEEPEEEIPSCSTDADDEFLEKCYILLLPGSEPWGAPAYRPFGSYPDCPSDAEHVAVLHRWHRRHGAEVLAMTGDTIELLLPEPILDPEVAVEVAREMAAYAPQIVHQGTEDLQTLADDLAGRRIWFFWWPS